ncbi:high-affinity Zn(2+) transporter zrt1 [Tulasnella sp. UAMH 9824]|nr:high-affinity Zn(2+) transporter zrt1 [Tulasnella sp. UAMH 9824]
MSEELQCGAVENEHTYTGLRIASIFVILAGSSFGALFPVIAKRNPFFSVPKTVYEFAKYFGSGVIIATAFIHLLAPAFEALGNECLGEGWKTYPWAAAITMMSTFALFLTELFAFRIGTAKLEALKVDYDPHGHALAQAGHHSAHGPEAERSHPPKEKEVDSSDVEAHDHARVTAFYSTTMAQIIGVSILEFGVIFHSVLIGLTLAVDEDFKVLFIVLVFHQTFEGLGLGSRLAYLDLPDAWSWARYAGAVAYGLTTPIGIAIGLGVRSTYNPGSSTASAVSGCLDAISAGILLYTGLVELLAHEFVFNPEAHKAPLGKLLYSIGCMVLGAGLMSLLGRWA